MNLIKSSENKLVISGENVQKVAAVLQKDQLKIRMQLDKMFSGYKTFVDLYYTEDLVVIDVNEDARITSDNVLLQDILELKAQEGGAIDLRCQTEQLLIKAVTGGTITTSGFTQNQDIQINTGGSYFGKEFKSSFSTVKVNAGGSAELYATKYVKADVKAGGKIRVFGNPEKMDEKKVLGGVIERVE